MKACFKRIDAETFGASRLELPDAPAAVGLHLNGRTGALTLKPGKLKGSPLPRLSSNGGPWRLHLPRATWGQIQVNGEFVDACVLHHGDVMHVPPAGWLVFVEHEGSLTQPTDLVNNETGFNDISIQVFRDWLLERGDQFGEHLGSDSIPAWALEGLTPCLERGQLEVTQRLGLIDEARIRVTEHDVPASLEIAARLMSLRCAQWLRSLTFDVFAFNESEHEREKRLLRAMRLVLSRANPQTLENLSFGYTAVPTQRSIWQQQIADQIRVRFPKLAATTRLPAPTVRHAALVVQHVPEGLNFRHDGDLSTGHIPLSAGVWVGSSESNIVRALTPGAIRVGLTTHAVISPRPLEWTLQPTKPVLLNGRPTKATRLLPGDVITDFSGVVFRFEATVYDRT